MHNQTMPQMNVFGLVRSGDLKFSACTIIVSGEESIN